MSKKNTYHPSLLIAFYLNFLPSDISERMPRSTLSDWRHRDTDLYFGNDWFLQNRELFNTLQHVALNTKLQKVNRFLIKCIALKGFISRHGQRIRNGFSDVCTVVLNHIRCITRHITLKKCLSLLEIPQRGYAIIKRAKICASSLLGLCPVRHPHQLLQKEVLSIKEYASRPEHIHWPLSSIYHLMRREGLAAFHLNTFYKYARLLSVERYGPRHRRKNHDVGIRATGPLELLHVDVTYFRTADRVTNYIYVVQDNHSRAILYARASLTLRASHVKEALREVLDKYYTSEKRETSILSDNGSENRLLRTVGRDGLKVRHLVAQRDIHFSNSMVEAAHKSLKYRWLYLREIPDHDALNMELEKAVGDFMARPQHVLRGLSPKEVLDGVPHHQIFRKTDYASELRERLHQNKGVLCCKVRA